MRILTVRQPWAWAIIHGRKDVENRVHNIAGDYRGPVAIHAALAWDWDTTLGVIETPHPTSAALVRGAIIGVVDLVGSHLVKESSTGRNVCFDEFTPTGEACSPWAQPFDSFVGLRGYHLVLRAPRPLREPISFKGALGLRRLDEAVASRIAGQLGTVQEEGREPDEPHGYAEGVGGQVEQVDGLLDVAGGQVQGDGVLHALFMRGPSSSLDHRGS